MENEKLNELSKKGKKVFDQVKKGAQERIKKLKEIKKGTTDKSRQEEAQ